MTYSSSSSSRPMKLFETTNDTYGNFYTDDELPKVPVRPKPPDPVKQLTGENRAEIAKNKRAERRAKYGGGARPKRIEKIEALPFSIKSLLPYANVPPPKRAGAMEQRHLKQSPNFRKFYDRGDFPIFIEHTTYGNRLGWKVEIEKLDYHHYLPLFFDGLCETTHPYEFVAFQGVHDMLEHGGHKVLNVVPQLIIPIKNALNLRSHRVICNVLKVLQHLVVCGEYVGEALVPYYRQILPILNLYVNINDNLGDGIDYAQQKRECIGDLVHETLQLMERYGGEDAFINIKYMVPVYGSVMMRQ